MIPSMMILMWIVTLSYGSGYTGSIISVGSGGTDMEETLVRRKPKKRNPRRTVFVTLFLVFALLTLAAGIIIMLPEWLYVEEVRVTGFYRKNS